MLIRFRKLIRHVLAQNNTSSSEISLNWIAGHADILGNELADKEAGRAADSADNSSPRHALPSSLHKDLPSSLSAIKQHHEAGLQSLWTGMWRKSPRHDHINSIDPSTPSRSFMKLTKNLDKKHTAIYTQLRTGHIPLNKHLHRFKSSETPLCFQCDNNCPETVHHFLFNGPKYVRERHVLRIKLGRKALSTRDLLASKHAQQALFKFINDTQRLKSHIQGHPDPTEGPSLIAAQNTYTQPKTRSTVSLFVHELMLMPLFYRPMPCYFKNPPHQPLHTRTERGISASRNLVQMGPIPTPAVPHNSRALHSNYHTVAAHRVPHRTLASIRFCPPLAGGWDLVSTETCKAFKNLPPISQTLSITSGGSGKTSGGNVRAAGWTLQSWPAVHPCTRGESRPQGAFRTVHLC